MFKDMNLLPSKHSNRQILKLLLENGMGHEEIVELDELKDSCHHLMDIENKLIKDLQTLSKSHNEQQNDDK